MDMKKSKDVNLSYSENPHQLTEKLQIIYKIPGDTTKTLYDCSEVKTMERELIPGTTADVMVKMGTGPYIFKYEGFVHEDEILRYGLCAIDRVSKQSNVYEEVSGISLYSHKLIDHENERVFKSVSIETDKV